MDKANQAAAYYQVALHGNSIIVPHVLSVFMQPKKLTTCGCTPHSFSRLISRSMKSSYNFDTRATETEVSCETVCVVCKARTSEVLSSVPGENIVQCIVTLSSRLEARGASVFGPRSLYRRCN